MPTELLLLFLLSWLVLASTATVNQTETKPGCQAECGNVIVPYPFGIGTNCSIDSSFDINCNTTFHPPKPFLGDAEVVQISQGEIRVKNNIASICFNRFGNMTSQISTYFKWSENTPYTFSSTKNKVTVIGCDTLVLSSESEGYNASTGCISVCGKREDVIDGSCSGIGCCQTSVPKRSKEFYATVTSLNNHTGVWSFDPCGAAFLAETEAYTFKASDFYDITSLEDVPIVVNFAVGNQTCREAKRRRATMACKENSYCYDSIDGTGYLCNCSAGYVGNPYLNQGCQGLGLGLLFLLVGGSWLFHGIKKRQLFKLKAKYFKQNGGLLLEEQMSSREVGVESIKLFTEEELKLATNNYDKHRILGQGGYGTVYKGILPDLSIVAIKKSKTIDESQLGVFINEFVILTQINHRNVVKLLGCCLETEVPLLVYEYVSNGTLFHHLHEKKGALSSLSWEDRLRIAAETAGALAYLHSAASIPIIHRDVKSANILLDDNHTAKVADFGASRLNPLDQTQISTLVQGTMGYLDPEYFYNSQLTEKSDVYSFGVVLAELLTGEKPLCFQRSEEQRNLATYFIVSMKENHLFELLEADIVNEGKTEQVHAVAKLTKRCLNLTGEKRPSMKEVAAELERLRGFQRHLLLGQSNEQRKNKEHEHVDLYPPPLDSFCFDAASGQPRVDREDESYEDQSRMTARSAMEAIRIKQTNCTKMEHDFEKLIGALKNYDPGMEDST
ncbi:Wall-associated receptor kinase [Thalictrum thalictroides]|uniref:Wall-associated receptor kinase n=1 Tax=Thalictrum thalictroides TaxID=46969 RepID=A0A7J6WMF6_THATH|nr:Wall-associated receptor kinase [Thalictrum thalictroides]